MVTLMKSLPEIRMLFLICIFAFTNLHTLAQKESVLYPIEESGKFGYIDENGKVAIKPQFDDAKFFFEGLARVKIGKKWGFIDRTGRLAVTPQFELASSEDANNCSLDFHEGMAAISLDGGRKWGYIDHSGRIVVQPKYEYADRFAEGIAHVANTYSETKGNETVTYIGGAAKYIDKQGNIISLPVVGDTFSEGLAIADIPAKRPRLEGNFTDGPKVGYIDKVGRFRIQPRVWVPYQFSEGLARVRAGDRDEWGYINHAGRVVVKMIYESAGDFHEGLARVKLGTMGFVNKSGSLAIRPAFELVGNFSGGLASACVENVVSAFRVECGYIDRSGRWAIDPTFTLIVGDFKGQLALACTQKKCEYINRAGKFVWAAPVKPDGYEREITASAPAGCSILSDKAYRNYPCTLEFKLF